MKSCEKERIYRSVSDPEHNYIVSKNGIITKIVTGDKYAGCTCEFDKSPCVYKEKCYIDVSKQLNYDDFLDAKADFLKTETIRKPVHVDLKFSWEPASNPPQDARPVFATIKCNGKTASIPGVIYCRLYDGSSEWFFSSLPEEFRDSKTVVTYWMDYPPPKED